MDEARSPDAPKDDAWRDLIAHLSALDAEDRETLSRHTGTAISEDPDATEKALRGSGTTDGSPAEFIALVGLRVGLEDADRGLATRLGGVSVQLSVSVGERQLAHACLAQTAFKFRKDPRSLAVFEEHCSEAMALGHAGTFCYERLSVLYEYRGEVGRAIEVCRRAEAALSGAGDTRSAGRFREKAESIGRRSDARRGG